MKKFRIQNGQIFEEQGSFHKGSLYFIGEKIVTEEEYRASGLPEETVDAEGGYVIPGLVDCLRIAVKEMGIPLSSAVKCAAVNPAKAIGIYGEYGSLTAGKYADLLILDSDLRLQRVFHRGILQV